MKTTSETIVFFGSGPVAAASLRLLAQHCTIEAVITKSSTLGEMSAVLPETKVLIANNRKELDALIHQEQFQSRLGVLIDFGVIVSRQSINYFPLGIINSHFSLLPQWRGADPISFSVLSGQHKTGVSLMLLVEAMDEGPILCFGEYDIAPNTTTPQLTDQLILLSDSLLRQAIPDYMAGDIIPIPQEQAQTIHGCMQSYSSKLTKEDAIVDWNKPATQLEREVRAFLGWPRSKTKLAGKDIVITKAHVTTSIPLSRPKSGQVFLTDEKELAISCGQDALVLENLIPAGKKEMTGKAFLAGHRNLLGL